MEVKDVLKENLRGDINLKIRGRRIGPQGLQLVKLLDQVYLQEGKVFASSIVELLALGEANSLSQADSTAALAELVWNGWLILEGDTFTPQDPWLERYPQN